jgi:hypothetical protein
LPGRYVPKCVAACLRRQPFQRHEGVADQVLGILEADGETDRACVDAGRGECALVELPVGGGGDVRDHRVRAAERGCRDREPERVRERQPGLAPPVGRDGGDRAEPDPFGACVEHAPRQLVTRVGRQPRVVHVRDRGVLGQRGGEHRGGGGLPADPDGQRLKAAAELERVVGGQRAAGVDPGRADLADQFQ